MSTTVVPRVQRPWSSTATKASRHHAHRNVTVENQVKGFGIAIGVELGRRFSDRFERGLGQFGTVQAAVTTDVVGQCEFAAQRFCRTLCDRHIGGPGEREQPQCISRGIGDRTVAGGTR